MQRTEGSSTCKIKYFIFLSLKPLQPSLIYSKARPCRQYFYALQFHYCLFLRLDIRFWQNMKICNQILTAAKRHVLSYPYYLYAYKWRTNYCSTNAVESSSGIFCSIFRRFSNLSRNCREPVWNLWYFPLQPSKINYKILCLDNGRFCATSYGNKTFTDSDGPFPIGEWSFFAPVHYINAAVPWFISHRGELSLLVHPNTGCENEGCFVICVVALFSEHFRHRSQHLDTMERRAVDSRPLDLYTLHTNRVLRPVTWNSRKSHLSDPRRSVCFWGNEVIRTAGRVLQRVGMQLRQYRRRQLLL